MLSLLKRECGFLNHFSFLMSLCFCICWWRLRVESKGKSFLCSMLFPFTVLVTIEMTLLGKGKYSQPCVSRYAWHFPAFSLLGSYTWPWVEEGGGGVRRREGGRLWPPSSVPPVHRRIPRLFFLVSLSLVFITSFSCSLPYWVDA